MAAQSEMGALQRYAADAMWAALHKTVVAMAVGKTDPRDPYCWDDQAAFELYMAARGALAAAERARLGQGRYFRPTCETCLHFRWCESGRADLPPRPRDEPTSGSVVKAGDQPEQHRRGVCTGSPPTYSHLPNDGVGRSQFSTVHPDWGCRAWEAITSLWGRIG